MAEIRKKEKYLSLKMSILFLIFCFIFFLLLFLLIVYIQKKLEAVEMWFLRRMLRIPWTAKKSNETVLKEADSKRSLVNKIRKRQSSFIGHVMRREKMEHLVTTGMLEGKRSRGRQREKVLDSLASWLRATDVMEMLKATKDRDVWRDMIANAMKHGT